MKNQKVKRMTGIAILTAVTIVLALISNNVTISRTTFYPFYVIILIQRILLTQ